MKKELWEGRGHFKKEEDQKSLDAQKQYAIVALFVVIILFVAVYLY